MGLDEAQQKREAVLRNEIAAIISPKDEQNGQVTLYSFLRAQIPAIVPAHRTPSLPRWGFYSLRASIGCAPFGYIPSAYPKRKKRHINVYLTNTRTKYKLTKFVNVMLMLKFHIKKLIIKVLIWKYCEAFMLTFVITIGQMFQNC